VECWAELRREQFVRGEICQFDLWRPSREIPVGFGQTRVGYALEDAIFYGNEGRVFEQAHRLGDLLTVGADVRGMRPTG
jgi:hypothetical protein